MPHKYQHDCKKRPYNVSLLCLLSKYIKLIAALAPRAERQLWFVPAGAANQRMTQSPPRPRACKMNTPQSRYGSGRGLRAGMGISLSDGEVRRRLHKLREFITSSHFRELVMNSRSLRRPSPSDREIPNSGNKTRSAASQPQVMFSSLYAPGVM